MKWMKRILWMLRYPLIVKACNQMGLVGYPTLVWVEFEGKKVFLEKGWKTFVEELEKHANLILARLVESCKPDHLKPIEERENSITSNITLMRRIRKQEEQDWNDQMSLINEMEKNMQFD